MFSTQLIRLLAVVCIIVGVALAVDECVCVCQPDRRLTRDQMMNEVIEGGAKSVFERLFGSRAV